VFLTSLHCTFILHTQWGCLNSTFGLHVSPFYPNKLRFPSNHDCNQFGCVTDAVYLYQEGNEFLDTE